MSMTSSFRLLGNLTSSPMFWKMNNQFNKDGSPRYKATFDIATNSNKRNQNGQFISKRFSVNTFTKSRKQGKYFQQRFTRGMKVLIIGELNPYTNNRTGNRSIELLFHNSNDEGIVPLETVQEVNNRHNMTAQRQVKPMPVNQTANLQNNPANDPYMNSVNNQNNVPPMNNNGNGFTPNNNQQIPKGNSINPFGNQQSGYPQRNGNQRPMKQPYDNRKVNASNKGSIKYDPSNPDLPF